MPESRVLRRVVLGSQHSATGRTVHRREGEMLPSPHSLQIEQLSSRNEFYLIHYDEQGREMTDTFHETVADALEQAEWEFGIRAEEWIIVSEPRTA